MKTIFKYFEGILSYRPRVGTSGYSCERADCESAAFDVSSAPSAASGKTSRENNITLLRAVTKAILIINITASRG